MKKLKILFISIFSLILILPITFFNFQKDYISELDNRKLAELPSFEMSDKYNKSLLSYIDDRYGGRTTALGYYPIFNDRVFGELTHPLYMYGKDGHIFFRPGDEISYTSYHQNFADYIVKMRDYVESKGSKFYLMINPEKSSVYREDLPAGLNYNRDWIEQFEAELSKYKINFVDNTVVLKEKSKSEDVYNRKFDAGHWNDLGAFYGVNNLLDTISKDFSSVEKLTFDDFDIKEKEEPYLKLSEFPIYEKTPEFILKDEELYGDLSQNYDYIDLDENYSTFSYWKNNNPEQMSLPKTLVYQGSYLNGREKYLKSRFSDYIAIHNYQNVFNIVEHFEEFNPDIVIFEVAEYTFNESYFAEESMKKTLE